ncbi:MAG: glycerophosphodiester phosphodiesterase [Candidatus Riflebacteria bacterium]|nr:glycerophosphodiester phosphodiesterase [Candidatus Riflebacteria bacterium]
MASTLAPCSNAALAAGPAGRPVAIAHRGACGYLPEHSLEAKAMAHAMGVAFLEQDVVLTRDGVPIVIHDHYLDTVTDVARLYPDRKRKDGRYYAIDFDLTEIRRLTLHERTDLDTGTQVYAGRFPAATTIPFRVPTLEEEIQLVKGLNKSTGRNVGLYVELKAPWFHRAEGKDMAKIVLGVLAAHGYDRRESNIYIQCFDPRCLRRMRQIMRSPLRQVQLIGHNDWRETPGVDHEKMLTKEGLVSIARYADGIGLAIDQLLSLRQGRVVMRHDIVGWAHDAGLAIHPYTFRVDALPGGVTPDALLDALFVGLRVDGLFTDFPDTVVRYLERRFPR